MIERKSGEALWRQIGEKIAAEIAARGLGPGARLPTEPELAARFDVSRNTVRRAMAMLEDGGLVRIEQGRGTFVHDGIINYEISRRTRYSENLARQGIDPGRVLRSVEQVPAPEVVAEHLRIAAGAPVVAVETLSLADGAVVSFNRMYYPAARFPGLVGAWQAGVGTTSALLAQYGIRDYTRLRTSITTRPPRDAEARALQQPRSRWVLVTQKVDVDGDGQPICFSETAWAGDRVQFVIDNSVE